MFVILFLCVYICKYLPSDRSLVVPIIFTRVRITTRLVQLTIRRQGHAVVAVSAINSFRTCATILTKI